MELIYFISGILTVGTVYGVLLLRKVKSSHALLLEESSRLLDLTHSTREQVMGKFDQANKRMLGVSEQHEELIKQMKNDAYIGNNELKKELDKWVNISNKNKQESDNLFGVADNQLKTINNELGRLRSSINDVKNNPNMIDRY